MSLFDDMLKGGESLFKNVIVLDFDYHPKLIPCRENEQRFLVSCIKPLFQERNARNVFIHGIPGIGKTVVTKSVLDELEEHTDIVETIYINCWQKNTTYKILVDICEQLGYKFTQNKRTEELFKIAKQIINKKSLVVVFDEIDKAEDVDFLYYILEEIYKSSIILITNYKEWILELEQRLKSRLMPEIIEFKPYNLNQTKEILKERISYALVDNCFDMKGLAIISTKTFEMQDIRSGLNLIKESTLAAEDRASKKVEIKDIEKAIEKLNEYMIKKPNDLEEDSQEILEIIKNNSDKKIGELHGLYKAKGHKTTYKTFQRKIKMLADNKFITVEKTMGGAEGNTTIVHFGLKEKETKLSDFE